jgi:hypothetical protein
VAAGVGEETGELVAGGLAADEGGEADEQRLRRGRRGATRAGGSRGPGWGWPAGRRPRGSGRARGSPASSSSPAPSTVIGEGAGARLAARPGAPREGLADVVVLDAGHVRQEVGDERERDLDAGVADLHGEVAGVDEDELAARGGACAGLTCRRSDRRRRATAARWRRTGRGAGGRPPAAGGRRGRGRRLRSRPRYWTKRAVHLERGIVAGRLAGGLQDDLDASEAAWRARLGDAVGRPRFIDDARTRDEPDSRKRHGGARPAMSGERGPAHGLWCTATRRGCHGSRRRARCGPWDWARNGRHKAVSAGALALRLAAQVSRPGRPEVARQVTDPGLRAAQAAVVIAVQIA